MTKSTQLLFATLALALAVAAISVVHADPSAPSNADPGVWMIVEHRVEDVRLWKPVHEHSAETKRSYGWMEGSMFSIDGDPNHVLVMERFDKLDRARAYAESKALLHEMAASGVSSQPSIRFVTAMAGSPRP